MPLLVAIFLSAVGVFGDYCLKRAGQESAQPTSAWFAAGALTYAATAFGWFYVIRHMKLAVVGVVYPLATALMLMALGLVVFRERLSPPELLGVASALLSIALLARFA